MAGRKILPAYGGPPRTQCVRFIKSRGRQCEALAEPGATCCRFHGGRIKRVKKNADERVNEYKERVLNMSDDALRTIHEKLMSPNHAVALRAALEILAINGVSGVKKSESSVTVTQKSELDSRIEELLSRVPQAQPDALGVSTGATDSDEERDE
jgi:hypothetical protein